MDEYYAELAKPWLEAIAQLERDAEARALAETPADWPDARRRNVAVRKAKQHALQLKLTGLQAFARALGVRAQVIKGSISISPADHHRDIFLRDAAGEIAEVIRVPLLSESSL